MSRDEPILARLGDFEVLRELGRGGMGIVYEARQVSLNRKVALKVLSGGLGLTGKAITRFNREAEAAAKLHHTHIVPIYTTGEEDGTHFYAMELIDGPSLDKLIKQMRRESERHGPESREEGQNSSVLEAGDEFAATVVDASQAAIGKRQSSTIDSSRSLRSGSGYFDTVARMIGEVADGLDYAHKQGVIHRDIKPSNLLLSPDGRLHINDFGLARMLEEPGMTISGEFLGSPSYMSPEQIAAGRLPLDHRTDIYSLGVVLYELLTLQAPFTGQSRDQVLAQIVQKEAKAPRSLNKKVPIDLETICLKAIEKDPDRRYQNARDMAEDLRRYLDRFAITARRSGPVARAMKWARRHPALAGMSGLVMLALFVTLLSGYHAKISAENLMAEKRQNALDKAMLVAMSGDLEAAEGAISQAELLSASVGQVRFLRGLVAYHRGEMSDAVKHLEQAVQLLPQSVSARAMLASAYNWSGQWDKHQQVMDVLEPMAPVSPEDRLFKGLAQSYQAPARGLANLDEAIRERNSPVLARVARAQVRADHAMDTSDLRFAELALEDVNVAKAMMPNNPTVLNISVLAHLVAAGLFESTGQPLKSEPLMTQAGEDAELLAAFPSSPAVALARLFYFRYTSRHDEFAREAQRAAEQSNRIFQHALALYERQELRQAAEVLDRKLGNRDQMEELLRAYILIETSGGVTNAQTIYNEYDLRYPRGDSVIYGKTILLLAGLKEEAVAAFREVRKDKSRLPKANAEFWEALLRFCCAEISENELLNVAGTSRRNQIMSHHLIALMRLAEGNRAASRHHFKEAISTRCFYFYDFDFSITFLQRMESDPSWPPWIPVQQAAR